MNRDVLGPIDWDTVLASLSLKVRMDPPSRSFRSWMTTQTHAHNYEEIVINLHGRHLYGVNGRAARLEPGRVLILPRGVPHDKWYGPMHAPCIDFWMHLLPHGPVTMGFVVHQPGTELVSLPVPLPVNQDFQSLDHLSLLWSERTKLQTIDAKIQCDFYLLYYLAGLFHKLRQGDFQAEKINESAIIAGVTKYVIANLTESLTLNDLAKAAGYSPFHFHRMFVKNKGITPRLFIEKKRLELAQSLLRENQTITTAALNSGFSSSSQFSQVFRKHFHLTPREWIASVARK